MEAAVLALNHEHREDNDWPQEGYLQQIYEAATHTWQIIHGQIPNGAVQRTRTRTGDTTHLTIYYAQVLQLLVRPTGRELVRWVRWVW